MQINKRKILLSSVAAVTAFSSVGGAQLVYSASEIYSEVSSEYTETYDDDNISDGELEDYVVTNDTTSEVDVGDEDTVELSDTDSETVEVDDGSTLDTSETVSASTTSASLVAEEESEALSEDGDLVEEEDVVDIDDDVTLTGSAMTVASTGTRTSTIIEKSGDDAEDTTEYVNQDRIDAKSGLNQLLIKTKSSSRSVSVDDVEIYYTIDEDGNLSEGSLKEPRSYGDENLIKVYNGSIVEADNAVVSSLGGYNYSFYMYDSIDDLKSNTNGTSMSGGAFEGQYIETIEDDGEYYYHILIAGFDGYVKSTDFQIIPEEFISAQSHYVVEDGDLVYYSAIDPLTSTEYDVMNLGTASEEMEEGETYYSNDDVNYYTEPLIDVSTQSSISYNTYFQNLPFRSQSSYTASDYKKYLAAKGKTSSEYYSETSAFIKAQSEESINSLLIFSMANHESAYGLSSYAKACYNFFGRGAIDSDPDQACQYYSYPTATDGILAQALFLENGYFDILDWRYSGTHVGNKASGMNVKYASDPDWGKKISNHAYMTDQYLGGKEEDKYSILQVSGAKHVYTTSSLSTKVKSSSDSGSYNFYDLSQMTGTSGTVNVVAVGKDGSSKYKIQVPTSVKQTSSSTCSYTNSKMGTYPNYGGRTNVSVATNTGNYSCDYESYAKQQYWISSSNTTIVAGKTTVSDVNDTYHKYVYHSNGKVKTDFYIKDGYLVNAKGYDEKGRQTSVYTYYDKTVYGNNHGHHIYNKFNINPSTGYLTSALRYTNNTKKIQYRYVYYDKTTYGSGHGSRIKYRFTHNTSTGNLVHAYKYNNNSKNMTYYYTYYDNTKYGSHGSRIKYRFKLKTGTDTIQSAVRYVINTKNIDRAYEYYDGAKISNNYGAKRKYVFYLQSNGSMIINYAYGYNTSNKLTTKYTYYSGTKYGSHSGRIKNKESL